MQPKKPPRRLGKEEEEIKEKEAKAEAKKPKEEPRQLLTQEEVDALLMGLRGGEIKIKEPTSEELQRAAEKYPRYDFKKVGRFISKMRLPALEVIHRRFSTDARSILSVALQKIMDISMLDTTVGEFGNFIDNVPLPALFVVITMKPMRGFSLWVLEAPLVLAIIDILLGGQGRAIKAEGREFTRIEQRLIRRVLSTILKSYQTAWEPVIRIYPEIVRVESHPQFATIVPESDLVVYTRYDVDLGMISGKMYVAIPYSTLEPIKSQLQAGYQPTSLEIDRKWVERLVEQLKACPVSATVELGRVKLTLEELLKLKKGDVLVLNSSPYEESAVVYIQNIPKFWGIPGVSGEKKSIFVTKLIPSRDEKKLDILRRLLV